MTEPVAYIYNYANGDYALWHKTEQHIEKAIPLYTKDQLHPRVKMTQAEFDEWHKLVEEVADLYTAVTEICDIAPYPNLYFRFFDLQNDDTDKTRKKQVEFATLWGIFDEFNPEETIEIVPDMKWFVRSKKSELKGYGWLSIIDKYTIPVYQYSHDKPLSMFVSFDTKEEAEKWTNPLTEAVQLPVEEE